MDKFLEWIKTWAKETGVEGWIGLIAGVILILGGFKCWGFFALGIFACKNWEWIKNGINSLLNRG